MCIVFSIAGENKHHITKAYLPAVQRPTKRARRGVFSSVSRSETLCGQQGTPFQNDQTACRKPKKN